MSGKHYGDIYIPPELIEAQQKNELVIFAGAGVSYAEPTNAKSLDTVAKDFCEQSMSHMKPTLNSDGSIKDLLRVLGTIDREHRAAFRQYVQRAYLELKRPSVLHRHIVSLFCINHDIRIVTTNYDDLFTVEVREHRGFTPPVLTYPDLFSQSTSATIRTPDQTDQLTPEPSANAAGNGIVHIHGSSLGPYDKLVLTRQDFQSAYYGPGSPATLYLRKILERYFLLIVGFSGDDPMVSDFIAAQCNVDRTHAICPEDEVDAWRDFGLNYSAYPIGRPNEKHRRLGEALENWASEANGKYDMGDRIAGDQSCEVQT